MSNELKKEISTTREVLTLVIIAVLSSLIGIFLTKVLVKEDSISPTLERVPFELEELKSFDDLGYIEFAYFQKEDWNIADRMYKETKLSPYYDPDNYLCRMLVDDSTIIYAALEDVRLVYDSNDSSLVRAYGTEEYCYVELNIEPILFESLEDSGMFGYLNEYQRVFVQQYLSDRAIDISYGDVRVPQCNMPENFDNSDAIEVVGDDPEKESEEASTEHSTSSDDSTSGGSTIVSGDE